MIIYSVVPLIFGFPLPVYEWFPFVRQSLPVNLFLHFINHILNCVLIQFLQFF